MKLLPFCFSLLVTLLLIYMLNNPIGKKIPMPLGSFLNPQTGFWQNAEDTSCDYNDSLPLGYSKGKATVYFDERLVPHVFAENDEDLYYIQGYLHAKFRLFQMDLQTKAAEGRVSEIAGDAAVNFDKEQRRLGMRFAAENTLKALQDDLEAVARYTAYTRGVNRYIMELSPRKLPVEYKILNFKPEQWTNLRTMLLLKMMAKNLSSGTENDLANTNLRSVLGNQLFNRLYPQVPDSLVPIVPKGTVFPKSTNRFKIPGDVDSAYFFNQRLVAAKELYPTDKDNGSNNWVVAGSKTASGAPILCNDPHLELSLPSIWYEMQLTTPATNSYGVSLPGSPYIIIGFNDSIAWGVTNSQRDVKDYYSIQYKDASRTQYWFNGEWTPVQQRIEEIKIKGNSPVFDTVAYTFFGPVMYDAAYPDTVTFQEALAVKWSAHHTGDDGATFCKLNKAKNYDDYVEAIKTFECPGQNFVFASKTGDIAIWQQGKFPERWTGQGMYVMPGQDSSYLWQGYIPQAANPHIKNPERGFLESANQRPADGTYPYFIPGTYITPRGAVIEHYLSRMNNIKVEDMMQLQNNYYNMQASSLVPILLKHVQGTALSPDARKYLSQIRNWDFNADPGSLGQTIYQCWLDSLQKNIWYDELSKAGNTVHLPEVQTLWELLIVDTTVLGFVDDKTTPQIEIFSQQVTKSLNEASVGLLEAERNGKLEWAKFKDPAVYHLLKNNMPSFARTHLFVGGSGNVINAIKKSHGPSWRMVVQLSANTEAYGVYPGGQSGNPGSKFYDNGVDLWEVGKYYPLWMMKPGEEQSQNVKWKMSFNSTINK